MRRRKALCVCVCQDRSTSLYYSDSPWQTHTESASAPQPPVRNLHELRAVGDHVRHSRASVRQTALLGLLVGVM